MGWLLVAMATAGLFPLWMQVTALEHGQVDTPEQAHYQVSASGGLVTCTVPSAITLQKETAAAGSFFECTNNYNASVSLTWSVEDDGGGGFLSATGSDSLVADGMPTCRDVTLTAGSVEGSRTVVFRGMTGSSSGLYVEVYFSDDVTVQADNTGLGGGCA